MAILTFNGYSGSGRLVSRRWNRLGQFRAMKPPLPYSAPGPPRLPQAGSWRRSTRSGRPWPNRQGFCKTLDCVGMFLHFIISSTTPSGIWRERW